MFFIGGLPALLALFVRFHVKESEVWERRGTTAGASSGAAIASHWKLFLYLVVLMTMMNFVLARHAGHVSHLPAAPLGLRPAAACRCSRCSPWSARSAAASCSGCFSDRIGRRRAMMLGARARRSSSIPLWAFAPILPLLDRRRVPDAVHGAGRLGVIPAHLTELSPDSVRGFLPGFAYPARTASLPQNV